MTIFGYTYVSYNCNDNDNWLSLGSTEPEVIEQITNLLTKIIHPIKMDIDRYSSSGKPFKFTLSYKDQKKYNEDYLMQIVYALCCDGWEPFAYVFSLHNIGFRKAFIVPSQ